jgi:uncharacterized NAD-dependent epimerase/dehydratase family protein
LDEQAARDYLTRIEDDYALPATDPIRNGVAVIVDRVLTDFPFSAPLAR